MLNWLFPTYSTCILCGREDISSVDIGICSVCVDNKCFSEDKRAVFDYDDKKKKLVLGLKYNNRRYLAKIFAGLAKDKIAMISYDIVCFVPTMKEKERGYNQAELIARAIDNKRSVKALVKIKDIPSQTTLSARQRMENVKGAYAVIDKSLVLGKRILLIDDVYTTGSTIKECAKMLYQSGAKEVNIFTIFKTPPKEN